jgi:uncharacterized protein YbjT (DUF2867 family)
MTYAIAGVTGNTGKIAAETLLAQNKAVRVLVRDRAKGEVWKTRGAEVAVADLGDATAVARALEGVEAAYLLIPPNMAAPSFATYQDETIASLAKGIEDSGVPHVVFLSSVGAQHPSGTGPIAGLHRAEKRFAGIAGTRFSHVRAAYFMENLGGSLGMLDQGILPSFTPAAFAFDMIATVDIGRLAAQLIVEGTDKSQVVELGGPPRSMNDAAAALSAITGKPIRVHELPLDAVVPTLTGMGLPAEMAGLYREMTGGLLSHHVAFEGGHRRVLGSTPLEQVLRGMLAGR